MIKQPSSLVNPEIQKSIITNNNELHLENLRHINYKETIKDTVKDVMKDTIKDINNKDNVIDNSKINNGVGIIDLNKDQ